MFLLSLLLLPLPLLRRLLRRRHRRNLSPRHCPYSHREHDRFSPAFPIVSYYILYFFNTRES